jgi:hypothetical protein
MIRVFTTPKPIEHSFVTITEAPEVVKILEDGILEPGILQ